MKNINDNLFNKLTMGAKVVNMVPSFKSQVAFAA